MSYISTDVLMYMGQENSEIASSGATSQTSAVEAPFSQSLDPEERNKLQLQIYSGIARNWNEEFQRLLDVTHHSSNDSEVQRTQQLRALCDEFAVAATRAGKIIISELPLPFDEKTIQPITRVVGGAAGGAKFFHDGIFFKFPDNSSGLYDSEESMIKALGHELKGLMAYMDCRIKDLHFPLMVLIDYRGWRLLAQSLVPVDNTTLVYGSGDGCRTIHSDNPAFNEKMERAAQILNLKSEFVLNYDRHQRVKLHSSCDVEGHAGRDGRFYLVDTARVLPPATPIKDKPNSFLWNMLRPELVKANPEPLCADSFSGFYLENKTQHNEEARKATDRLENLIIPNYAQSLLGNQQEHKHPHPEETEFGKLLISMHQNGINLRYLGLVYNHICGSETFTAVSASSATVFRLRTLLLTEMVARVVKHEIRKQMRAVKSSDASQFIKVVTGIFNSVFGRSDASLVMWQKFIRQGLVQRFPGIKIIEKNVQFSGVSVPSLFVRLQRLCGVEMTEAINEVMKNDSWKQQVALKEPVNVSDVQSVNAIVKHMHRIYWEQGFALSQAALTWGEGHSQRDILLDMARGLFEESLRVKPNDIRSLHNIGYSMFLQATSSQVTNIWLIEQAAEMFQQAVKLEAKDYKSLFTWAQCLVELAKHKTDDAKARYELFDSALDKYKRAVSLTKKARKDTRAKIQFLLGSAYLARADIRNQNKRDTLTQSNMSITSGESDVVMTGTTQTSMEQDIASALEHYEEAVKLGSNDADTFHNYGIALSKRARCQDVTHAVPAWLPWFERALEQFSKASQLKSHSFEIHFNWGNTLLRCSKMLFDDFKVATSSASGKKLLTTAEALERVRDIRKRLNSAAGCYHSTVINRPTYNATYANWAQVIRTMAEVEKRFQAVLSTLPLPPTKDTRKKKTAKKPRISAKAGKRSRGVDESAEAPAYMSRSSKRRKVIEDIYDMDIISDDDNDEESAISRSAEEEETDPTRRIESVKSAAKDFLKRVRDILLKESTFVKVSPILELQKVDFLIPYVIKTLEEICFVAETLAKPPALLIQECRAHLKAIKEKVKKSSNAPALLRSASSTTDAFEAVPLAKLSVSQQDTMQVDNFEQNALASSSILDQVVADGRLANFSCRDIVPESVWELTDSSNQQEKYVLKVMKQATMRPHYLSRLSHGRVNIFKRPGDPDSTMTFSQLPSLSMISHSDLYDDADEDDGENTDSEDEERIVQATQSEEVRVSDRVSAAKDQFLNQIVGYFSDPPRGRTFVAFKWIPSCTTVDSLLKTYGPLPADVARFIAAETLLAIERLHALRLTLLMLRPENILLDQDGHIRVIPVLNFADGDDHERFAHLLSPEVIMDKMDLQGDFWALGTFVYFLFTGQHAFEGNNIAEIYDKVTEAKAHFPMDMDADAVDFCRCLFEPRLEARYTTSAAVRSHKFFAPIDWNRLRRGRVDSPVFPTLLPQSHGTEQTVEFSQMFMLDGPRNDFMGHTFVVGGFSQLSQQDV